MAADLEELRRLVAHAKWREAKTYAATAPHEYVLCKDHPDLCGRLARLIETQGYGQRFWGRLYRYVNIDGYRYWRMGEVLNRDLLGRNDDKRA